MPSSAIQVLWLCRRPWGVRPSLTGQPAGERDVLGEGPDPMAARRCEADVRGRGGWPHGNRVPGPGGGVGDDQPGGAAGRRLVAPVAGWPEHPAGVVAPAVVAAVGAEEHVLPAAAVPGGAGAWLAGLAHHLAGEERDEKRRQVDGEAGFPMGTAVGVILGRQPVEGAPDLAELPLDVDLTGVEVTALQADRFAPPQAGVGDREDHGELVVAAG